MLLGTVTDFDQPCGLGTITSSGGVSYLFHCIEIIDGSRTIDIGQPVGFDLLARFGRYQASRIDKR